MLKTKSALAIFLMITSFVLFSIVAPAQTKAGTLSIEKSQNAVLVSYSADVDSNAVVYSEWFSVPDYLPYSLYTYPVNYTKIQSSTLGKPCITVTLERSNDQSNVIITDTIGTIRDSLETLYNGTANFNNGKSWYYRLKFTGETATATKNRSDATCKTDLVFIRPKD